jgi:hypothetical protein
MSKIQELVNIIENLDPIEHENFVSSVASTSSVISEVMSHIYIVRYKSRYIDYTIFAPLLLKNQNDLYREFSKHEYFREIFDHPGYTDEDWYQLLLSETDQELIII